MGTPAAKPPSVAYSPRDALSGALGRSWWAGRAMRAHIGYNQLLEAPGALGNVLAGDWGSAVAVVRSVRAVSAWGRGEAQAQAPP